MEGRHEIEICGASIVIEEGKAKVISPPRVKHCPMRSRVYGTVEEDAASVLATLDENVREWGMFTSGRVLRTDERTVSFGASEIFADALKDGLIDCAVTVCEGVGSFVSSDPQVVQAVGAHMTGILSTSPISTVQKRLRSEGCHLLDDRARIDQLAGLELAASLGHRRIAVTVTGKDALNAQALRVKAAELGIEAVIAGVHTTAVCGFTAEVLVHYCDMVHLCASAQLWKKVGQRALLQLGTGIPVIALSKAGKMLILNRAINVDGPLLLMRSELPRDDMGDRPRPLYQPDCATDMLLEKE